jgi:phosphoribosylformylglycinamidine cyclo-ligase
VDGREGGLDLPRIDLGGASLADALLTPTRIYVRSVLGALREGARVKGMAHITGGGITENLNRCLPKGVDAVVARGSWKRPRIFDLIAQAARLDETEMLKTFNMGIGLGLVVGAKDAAGIAVTLREAGETVFEIGSIEPGSGTVRYA